MGAPVLPEEPGESWARFEGGAGCRETGIEGRWRGAGSDLGLERWTIHMDLFCEEVNGEEWSSDVMI